MVRIKFIGEEIIDKGGLSRNSVNWLSRQQNEQMNNGNDDVDGLNIENKIIIN